MKSSLQRKVSERQEELEARQAALAAAGQENAALRATIASQPVNKADLARLLMERCVCGCVWWWWGWGSP